ncbi:MAG TPA: hypothetical protein VH796_11030 [Nitrososphaeraceae archaeon]
MYGRSVSKPILAFFIPIDYRVGKSSSLGRRTMRMSLASVLACKYVLTSDMLGSGNDGGGSGNSEGNGGGGGGNSGGCISFCSHLPCK